MIGLGRTILPDQGTGLPHQLLIDTLDDELDRVLHHDLNAAGRGELDRVGIAEVHHQLLSLKLIQVIGISELYVHQHSTFQNLFPRADFHARSKILLIRAINTLAVARFEQQVITVPDAFQIFRQQRPSLLIVLVTDQKAHHFHLLCSFSTVPSRAYPVGTA